MLNHIKVRYKLIINKFIKIVKDKIKIIFKAGPSAVQIVSPGKEFLEAKTGPEKTFAEILKSLVKRYDFFKQQSNIYFYVSNTFAVYPNARLRDIYENFGAGGVLTVNYGIGELWG